VKWLENTKNLGGTQSS